MQPFAILKGLVAPMDHANVDTDAIIPKQFLKSIERTGFGDNLFDEWRYLDHGEPGMDVSKRPLNPDFVLNQQRYQGAEILLALMAFAKVVVNLTPSITDDRVFSYVDLLFNAIIANNTKDKE